MLAADYTNYLAHMLLTSRLKAAKGGLIDIAMDVT